MSGFRKQSWGTGPDIYSLQASQAWFAGRMGALLTRVPVYLLDSPEAASELILHLEEIICLQKRRCKHSPLG